MNNIKIIGKDKYCEICKPGMIVVSTNFPKNIHDSWPSGPAMVLKNAPCVCKKKDLE